MKRALLSLALLCFAVSAQAQTRTVQKANTFAYYKATTLSGATEKVTLQQPASGHKSVFPKYAVIESTVDTVWTLSIDGTAASSTAGTAIQLGKDTTATATVWHTSNAGAGTVVMPYPIAAADHPRTIDLTAIQMLNAGTTNNVSIATDSISGDVKILIVWEEQ